MELVILADDFTGAGDSAGAFAAGREVLVVLSATDSGSLWDKHTLDVLAVDLDLREHPDLPAREKTEHAARHLGSISSGTRVFLKIDSTLRGPVAGLVAGALAGSGKNLAVIAPAFPEQGRLLLEGRVVVDGQPGASVTSVLGVPATALVGAKVAGSAEAVDNAVEHARMLGARRVVVDADSSECLQSVAAAWRDHPDWLLVGSGGLARQVAGPSVSRRGMHVPSVTGPVLVIAGSPTPVTAAQIDQLRGLGSVTTVTAGSAGIRGGAMACVAEAGLALAPPPRQPAHGLLVLRTPPVRERDAGESAQAIADTVDAWSRRLLPAAVILAGGATARKVCERLGAAGVRLLGELSPGVPIGRLVGGRWDQVLVVTKAGGFGTPTTLLDAVRSLGVLSS